MRQTIRRAQTCLGEFGGMSLSRILHDSNEGGQVRACFGKYKHICSSFARHRLLGYGSDLKEIVLTRCA